MRWFLTGLLLLGATLFVVPARAEETDKPALVKGNNEFALELYGKLRAQEGNLFLSPNSISTALGMTSAGARGDTLTEMEKALHFNLDQDKLHPAFAALLKDLNGDGKKRGYQLSVANRLWGQKGFGFRPPFLKTTEANYGAGLEEVNFGTPEARQTINAWVEKMTQEKIKDLIKEGVLTADTRLVLTNAIYFKGNWDSQFKKDATKDRQFRVTEDRTVTVPMMHQKNEFVYHEGDDFQLLQMPYVGKELSMVVLLPKKVDGLPALEKRLTADTLAGWIDKARERKVDVTLPKFKMTSEFALADKLSALGMAKAFTPSADLSGMGGKPGDLWISAVVHKAFVDVNEEGTEAAAATAVVVTTKSVRIDPVFVADHPFVFLIRDNRSGSILFLGRLANPK